MTEVAARVFVLLLGQLEEILQEDVDVKAIDIVDPVDLLFLQTETQESGVVFKLKNARPLKEFSIGD